MNHYELNNRTYYIWHNFYESEEIQLPAKVENSNIVIFEGLERAFKNGLEQENIRSREAWTYWFEGWRSWEKQEMDRHVIFIGCDISKGIVPMDKSERLWRDLTGWCFQDLSRLSNRVDVIWSGLSMTMKESDGDEVVYANR